MLTDVRKKRTKQRNKSKSKRRSASGGISLINKKLLKKVSSA